MHDFHHDIARVAIALHLDVAPETIDPAARLDRDLGLDAFDLVLIVLCLDELTHANLAIADVDSLITVNDVQNWVASCVRDARDDDDASPVRMRSGVEAARASAPAVEFQHELRVRQG